MIDVVIIDAGGANLASLQYALERLGARSHITCDAQEVASATHVILPGVGAAGHAMARLTSTGLRSTIRRLTQPVLGICLGMQLLYRKSEEDAVDCLDLIPDTVRRIHAAPDRPVPHMGWNQLSPDVEDSLVEGIGPEDYAYFVHSYAAPVSSVTLAHTVYGKPLSAVVRRGNFCGTQFHPERSGKTGARLLKNFLRL